MAHSSSLAERVTPYGRLLIGSDQELFAQAVSLASSEYVRAKGQPFVWALTGGSTPQQWYAWCVEQRALPADLVNSAHFTVSDERHVLSSSDQSNFGNAQRQLFQPLGIDPKRCHPWKTELSPSETVASYRETLKTLMGGQRAYDVCFLGMGDDAHTASFFPGSPLLKDDQGEVFTSVDVVEKGLRFTISPTGLRQCGLIVVMTLGAAKAPALKRVFQGPFDPTNTPAQILKTCAERVVWLVDEAAAAQLT